MRRALFIGAGLAVLVLMPSAGCSSDSGSPTQVDSGVDQAADSDAKRESDAADRFRPAGLPDGWVPMRAFDDACGFYSPSSKDLFPAPIAWEPCPASVNPAGLSCRLMGPNPSGKGSGSADAISITEDGRALISTYRTAIPNFQGGYWIIAEADGPVHNALVGSSLSACTLAFASIFRRSYVVRVYVYQQTQGGGFFAGDVDSLAPRIVAPLKGGSSHSMYAGPFSILDLTSAFTFEQYAWDDGHRLPDLWSAAQDNGLDQGIPIPTDGALFWPADNASYQKMKVHTPKDGVQDFLTAGATITHGYGDLGTDGKDLVWVEAQGRKAVTDPFDTYTIMTAPFTSSPSAVQPRRVRSETGPAFGTSGFVVGCGHSARTNGTHTRVVRLSDGRSWLLPSTAGASWIWGNPLALTCDELFASASVDGTMRVVRTRLDSLGPGVAAD
jgi:hypothetical protein